MLNVYFQSFKYVNKRAIYKLKDKSLNKLSIIFLNGCVSQDAKILSPAMMSFSKLLIHIYDCLLNTSNYVSQKHLKINMPKTEQTFDFFLSLKLPSSDFPLNNHLFKCRSHFNFSLLISSSYPIHKKGLYLPPMYIFKLIHSNSLSTTMGQMFYRDCPLNGLLAPVLASLNLYLTILTESYYI